MAGEQSTGRPRRLRLRVLSPASENNPLAPGIAPGPAGKRRRSAAGSQLVLVRGTCGDRRGTRRLGGLLLGLAVVARTLDDQARQDPVEPAGEPPVGLA